MNTKRMKNSMLIVALLLMVLMCASVSAGTLAWWRFEGTGASEVNSPALDMTLGPTVTFGTNVPGALVSGPSNTRAYVQGSGAKSTFGNPSIVNSVICNGDFTLEAFVYVNPGADIAWDTIIGAGTSATGWSLWMHHDGHNAREMYFFGWRGDQPASSFYLKSGISLVPGYWYHVAVVGKAYDMGDSPDRQQLDMYINYELISSINLYAPAGTEGPGIVGPFIVVPTTDDTGVGAANPFEGSFDEIRISDTALTPAQFLQASPELSIPNLTAAWWRFENNYNSDPNDPALTIAPSASATFIDETPGYYVGDVRNTASYRHGTSGPSEIYDYEILNAAISKDFTVEAFIRPPLGDYSTYSPILSNMGTTTTGGWSLGLGWPGNGTTGKIGLRAIQSYDSTEKRLFSDVTLTRGVWNHVALVGTHGGAGTYTDMRLYVNYTFAGYMRVFGSAGVSPIKLREETYVMGANNPFNGDLDEIRVTATDLQPEQFLHADSRPRSCQDVAALGYGLAGDLSEDCYVTLEDFSLLVDSWNAESPLVTDPYPVYCGDKGTLGQTTYYASPITSAMTLDGNLSEWPAFDYDAENWCKTNWVAVDMIYGGYLSENVTDAYMCLMYDPCDDVIYGAVKFKDADPQYASYTEWNAQDCIEIYCKGDPYYAADGSYSDTYALAQQYVAGLETGAAGVWMAFGDGIGWDEAPQWDPGLDVAISRVSMGGYDELVYEFKIVPYDYFGSRVIPIASSELTDLYSGKEVGFDLIIDDKGASNFGMLCPNTVGGKYNNFNAFSTLICE